MTATAVEAQTIADLDTVPRCVDCDQPAVWIGRYRTCAHWHLFCDEHRARSDRRAREARQSAACFVHNCCGTANPGGIGWRPL